MLIVLTVLSLGPVSGQERKLEFVLALWRHGARSPMEFDPYVNDDLNMWPDGTGQLTKAGVEMHQGISIINFTHKFYNFIKPQHFDNSL